MIVRREEAEDREAADEVHRRAFAREDEATMARLVRASDAFVPELSLVAVEGTAVVGHVLVSYVGLEGSDRRLLQLGPIGVVPERQRQGIGTALVDAVLEGARALGEPLVLLEGDPAYYVRFGFVRADRLGLLPPANAPPWAFQVAVLDEGVPLPQGRVVYPPTFPD